MVPVLALGDKQATLSLKRNQFCHDPYFVVHGERGKPITIVDDTGTVSHDDLSFITPFLNGKMLDLDVAGTGCGSVFVDHRNRSLIVDEQRGRTRSKCIEFLKNVAEIFGCLHASNTSIELIFCRAGLNDRLYATPSMQSLHSRRESRSL